MVAFIKSISNAQMVEALNGLVHLNYDLISSYDKAIEHSSDSDQRRLLSELKSMHEQNVQHLSDQVRLLGGAPVDSTDWREWTMRGKTFLAGMGKEGKLLVAMQDNERTLRDAYVQVIDKFAVSEEVVTIINKVLDEGQDLRNRLEQAADREKGS